MLNGQHLLVGGTRHRRVRNACVAAKDALSQQVAKVQKPLRRARHKALDLPASVLLLSVAVGLPIVTFAKAYYVSDRVTAGDIWRRKGYFLSAAIDVEPAANFGAFGLTLSIAAFMGVAVVRHHVVAERCRAAGVAQALGRLHTASLTAAIAAAVGGHGVAAFQHHADRHVHNAFAACFVLCALLHFFLESLLERRAQLSSRLARTARLSLVLAAAAGCATFISHVVVEESRHVSLGIGKLRAACAEIATCACFLVYLATYTRSFHETRIALTVTVPAAAARAPPPLKSVESGGGGGGGVPWGSGGRAAELRAIRRCASATALLGSPCRGERSPGHAC